MADIQLRTHKSPERAALHGVHSLDALVFTVPDLDEAARFYDAFGLEPKREATGSTCTPSATRMPGRSLYQAPGVKKLQYLRFACFAGRLRRHRRAHRAPGRRALLAAPAGRRPRPVGAAPGGFSGAGRRGRRRARRTWAASPSSRRAAPWALAPRRPRAHSEGASAPALAHPDVLRQGARGFALLRRRAGLARYRPLGRSHRVHARRARQRPPPDCDGAFRTARGCTT